MDHARPIPALFPGARGAVLDVLTRIQTGMTIRQIADRAGVSHPQAAQHLRDLEALGIVRREHVGRSHRITLTSTLAADLLRRLTGLRGEVVAEMREQASLMTPRPFAVIVYGSFARGDDHGQSDIDVLIVVDDSTPEGAIDAAVADWCERIGAVTGNAIAEIVVTRTGYDSLDARLRSDIERDGVLVCGAYPAKAPHLKVVAEGSEPYGA